VEEKRAEGRAGAAPREAPGLVQERARRRAAAPLADFTPEQLGELADELMRTRDGQIVVGRAVPADEAARWTEAQYRSAALETFRALAPLYRLR
jgi:uncharacterized protein YktB (UPF0637 family)